MENEKLIADTLRKIARNLEVKRFVMETPEIYNTLLKPAKRYIAGDKREEGIRLAKSLRAKGYGVSMEYIGENTDTAEACQVARDEFLALILDLADEDLNAPVCLDLSHIGLSVSKELAITNMEIIANEAFVKGITIMISMEEASKTEDILQIYQQIASQYPNVGITIQAHLHRSMDDLKSILHIPGKIRIVKGAFQEAADVAMNRSAELNERYLELVELCIQEKHAVSIATHDEYLLQRIQSRGYLNLPFVEIEMLFGVKPDLIKHFNHNKYSTRVYVTYGSEWYLYLCHRLAEHVPNVAIAIADINQIDEIKYEVNY
ncbi:proline dehydrogenase family protein [Paenibacillus radicibacter]|uniref:proline dehydrogenase family protein n=1 Tax=Paenibacillus radicibacter TaxID=2972488 RepID=UPI00358E79A6